MLDSEHADDAIAIDDAHGHSLALLIGERLVVLRALGPLIWELTAEPRTAAELFDAPVARVCGHPDGEQLLGEQLDALAGHGVLQRG